MPVKFSTNVDSPTAVLDDPVVVFDNAYIPTPVLFAPVVFLFNTNGPSATLLFPVVFTFNALYPNALLFVPDIPTLFNADCPNAQFVRPVDPVPPRPILNPGMVIGGPVDP